MTDQGRTTEIDVNSDWLLTEKQLITVAIQRINGEKTGIEFRSGIVLERKEALKLLSHLEPFIYGVYEMGKEMGRHESHNQE